MIEKYYICRAMLNREEIYFFWISNDHDRILLEGMTIPVTNSLDLALDYAAAKKLALVSQTPAATFNLDAIRSWCQQPLASNLDCVGLLDAWNLFGDLRNSLPKSAELFRALSKDGGPVYDKLFFGSNLPLGTPQGEPFEPSWSEEELDYLSRVLRLGIREFDSRVRKFENTVSKD